MTSLLTSTIGAILSGTGNTGTPVSTSPFGATPPSTFGATPPVSPTGPIDLNAIGLSPLQQALADFTGGQQDLRIEDIYSRLGLGGSTMEAQDLSGNELARLAQEAGLVTTNEQLALQNAGLATQQNIASGQQATQQNVASGQQATNTNIAAGQQSIAQGNQLLNQINRIGASTGAGAGGLGSAAAGAPA